MIAILARRGETIRLAPTSYFLDTVPDVQEGAMNRFVVAFTLVLVSAPPCAAIPITFFVDVPTFIERSSDIVIARCIRPDLDMGPYIDGLHPAEVEVLDVLMGGKTRGKMRIATTYELEVGKTCFLACGAGGFAYGTNFLAIAERSVVKLPAKFRLDDLKGKKLAELIQAVFQAAGLRESDLLSKKFFRPLEVMQLPPDGAGTFALTLESIVQMDKERVTRAAQKLQHSKSVTEMREAVLELEEATKTLNDRLAKWRGTAVPSRWRKP
jgi:hypothetical protein